MIQDENMDYELFIRNVFECNRGEDPLRLADAEINDTDLGGKLTDLRLGVAYALRRLAVRLEDECEDTGPDYNFAMDASNEIISNGKITYEEIHKFINKGLKILEKLKKTADQG